MTKAEYTIADIRNLTAGTAQGAAFDFLLAQDHDARVEAVQKGIDFACNELEQHKHKKQELGEDSITLEICSMLKMAGFQAAHDEDVGGHCDIIVKGKDSFLWLAEAKKHRSYAWLDKGFQQLSTRYSTGTKGRDHGELLIYCYDRNAAAILRKWRDELVARNPGVKIRDARPEDSLIFFSTHQHCASGLDFHVRHKAVALLWSPKDK